MRLLKELAYQCLLLTTTLGLFYVASDLSGSVEAVEVFSGVLYKSANVSGSVLSYLRNVLLPFTVYMLSCGGFLFLISENIRLWKTLNHIKPMNKLMWTVWVIVLGIMSLLPVYLGTSLIFKELWYIYVVISVLFLFYWVYWVSRN